MRSVLQLAIDRGLLPSGHSRGQRKVRVAVDATGLESRHVSVHFMHRRDPPGRVKRGNKQPTPRYPVLGVACEQFSHLWLGGLATEGPDNESPLFSPLVRQAARAVRIDTVLADAAYDTDEAHRVCRDRLGIRSSVIPLNRRGNGRKWPRGKYRRQMKRRFHTRVYGQRWQVESSFSADKRRFGSALRSTSARGRSDEIKLRVMTHNIALVLRLQPEGFQQSSGTPVPLLRASNRMALNLR